MPHDRKNYNKMQCLILTPIGGPRGYPGSGGVPLPDGRGSVKAGGGAVWRRIFCSFSSSRRARKKARSKRSWNLASGSSMASCFSSGYTSQNDGLAALGTHQFPLGDGHFFEQSHFGGYLGAAIRPPVRRRVGGIALHFRCAGRRRGRACHGDFERAKPIWYGARDSILLTE